jgi:hypothetical protein
VPCERLFSASKQTADDRQASLGANWFEKLQLMKFAWWGKIMDITSSNSGQIEVVNLDKYCEMLEHDIQEYEFEKRRQICYQKLELFRSLDIEQLDIELLELSLYP